MKKDKRSDLLLKLLKPFASVWMWWDTTTRVTTEVDFKRKEPFVLLGNHVYLFDVVQLALPFKKTPAIVASEFLMSVKGLAFVLKHIAKVIPKSKGAADIRTAKGLIRYVRKGYPVMIMPEGDNTYFGDTGYIEEATAKLVKTLKVDVVVGLFRGGYLSKPRWAMYDRQKRYVELHYKTIIKKEDIPNLTHEEIYETIKKELYNNDYEWQREVMHPYGGKRRAEGLENLIYKCPECGGLNTFETHKHNFTCTDCNTVGTINKYGFLEGFKYDNLVDWDNYQKDYIEDLRNATFTTTAEMIIVDNVTFQRSKPKPVSIAYHDNSIFIKGEVVEEFKIEEMHNPVLTMRRNLSFDYNGVSYMFKVDKYAMSFLRACQSKY